jgi:hypothetical protein
MRKEKTIMECMDFESDTKNWNDTFKNMCRFCGKEFIEILRAMWSSNEGVQTEDEFCEMNSIPKSFFEKTIKQ